MSAWLTFSLTFTPHIGIDEYMKHFLQAKLVEAIVVRK